MSSRDYTPDEYELERRHELNRRLEIAAEQEPAWAHHPRSRYSGRNRPSPERRYFSRLIFRPIRDPAPEIAIDEAA